NNVESTNGTDRHVDRGFRPLGALWDPAAIGQAYREGMAMQVDRVAGHAQIRDAHPHPVALAHYQVVDPREHPGVPSPYVEIQHGGDLRHVGTGFKIEIVHNEDEIAVDTAKLRVAGMDNEGAHHAHGHLHHLVGVRVVHVGSALRELELVNDGLPGLHV